MTCKGKETLSRGVFRKSQDGKFERSLVKSVGVQGIFLCSFDLNVIALEGSRSCEGTKLKCLELGLFREIFFLFEENNNSDLSKDWLSFWKATCRFFEDCFDNFFSMKSLDRLVPSATYDSDNSHRCFGYNNRDLNTCTDNIYNNKNSNASQANIRINTYQQAHYAKRFVRTSKGLYSTDPSLKSLQRTLYNWSYCLHLCPFFSLCFECPLRKPILQLFLKSSWAQK